ncbi:ATP:cob(I)alamin adenosyltransferase [Thiogranum longum]|uniref:Corrinoid adenosyltransferase n=1 Tax=Thiogranum longum TaxID=1537524 RepID=A0A4R1HFX1_9GAMM|nr:cob(I)yrinic acid a,c-diamide adenosyltransferase [Thiogranum longum]TCK19275.1 ATP:cob(I)alamin adenosyltransferase [Thiogranum longum]
MGHRLSKIYTRTGDNGETGLGDGSRVSKDAFRIEAIGTIDELNSLIGVMLSGEMPEEIRAELTEVQHQLFDLGGELSIPGHTILEAAAAEQLEQQLDALNASLPMLKEFILPGGCTAAAHCHLARSVCRRAERRLITLAGTESINPAAVQYINRLSDYLFVLARHLNRSARVPDVLWRHDR